jgi:hypothetical protein
MFTKAIVSSLLLAALANGLAIKRDHGYDSSTPPAVSLPTVTPEALPLPDPSVSLSLPPLDSKPTGTPSSIALPDPSISLSLPPLDDPSSQGTPTTTPLSGPTISLPDPSISLSLPPLDPSSQDTPPATLAPSPLPSVVTTTVTVYPSECSGTLPPTPGPSGAPNGVPQKDPITLPSESTPIKLPEVHETPLVLPPVRRDGSVLSKLRALQQNVVNTWVNIGKGDDVMSVVGQLESIITQAGVPGADGPALLKQAQSLVYNK